MIVQIWRERTKKVSSKIEKLKNRICSGSIQWKEIKSYYLGIEYRKLVNHLNWGMNRKLRFLVQVRPLGNYDTSKGFEIYSNLKVFRAIALVGFEMIVPATYWFVEKIECLNCNWRPKKRLNSKSHLKWIFGSMNDENNFLSGLISSWWKKQVNMVPSSSRKKPVALGFISLRLIHTSMLCLSVNMNCLDSEILRNLMEVKASGLWTSSTFR